MNLQDVFYVVAIIYFVIQIVLFLGVLYFLLYLRKELNKLTVLLERQMNTFRDVVRHPEDMAANVGAYVADKAVSKLRSYFSFGR